MPGVPPWAARGVADTERSHFSLNCDIFMPRPELPAHAFAAIIAATERFGASSTRLGRAEEDRRLF
jgi:hypothetical protein